jgi:hypothetical protein
MTDKEKGSKMAGKLYIGAESKDIAEKVFSDVMPNRDTSDKNLTDEERQLFYEWLKKGDAKPIELAVRLALVSLLARLRGITVRQAAGYVSEDNEVG